MSGEIPELIGPVFLVLRSNEDPGFSEISWVTRFFKLFSFSENFFCCFFSFRFAEDHAQVSFDGGTNLFLIKDDQSFLLMPVRGLYDTYFVLWFKKTNCVGENEHLV